MDVCERDILNYPEAFFFCRIALSQTSYNAQHNWKSETAEMQSEYTPINLKGWKKNIPQLSKHREKPSQLVFLPAESIRQSQRN